MQGAAGSGDLAAAKLLLVHDPIADVNAPPCAYVRCSRIGVRFEETKAGNALDCASMYGRIDMVKLLLSYNALSHYRGETVYEGSIECARMDRHFAVANLIIQHCEDARRSGTSPDLSQPWKDYHVYYGCKCAADWDSELSEDDESSTSCSDMDMDDLLHEDFGHDSVGSVSSGKHQDDPSDAHVLVGSFSHDNIPTATINDTNAWTNQEASFITQDEHLMAMGPCHSLFQDTGLETSTDFDMTFGSGAREIATEQNSGPSALKNREVGSTAYCSLPRRDISELGEDDE